MNILRLKDMENRSVEINPSTFTAEEIVQMPGIYREINAPDERIIVLKDEEALYYQLDNLYLEFFDVDCWLGNRFIRCDEDLVFDVVPRQN